MGNIGSSANDSARQIKNSSSIINASFTRITKSSREVTKNISKINTPVKALTNELKRTTKRFLTIGAAWKSVQNSMNFIETLNYFDRAFEQVASNADLSSFSEMGYKSAEEYFNSFSERAKELTAKMSGFNVNVDGTLTASGMPSLGIDPDKLMNYQAMFGQMSSSMGVASESALKLSNALTMIGADLASVKNMNFDKVWNDMASGLAGMSRTLDKYGANIRNVNLQQKLNELGIKANISALNQNDKALLRGIILLDSTRYAWGDLANTLNQPANQLRLIEGNIQNLSRTIGNLLLPVIAKALPYINGFVIALQRFFAWLGKIFKIDLSNLLPKGGGGSGAISDLIGDTGELEDGLNAATAAAKKLNKQVRAFDELNVISTSSAGAGGIGSGLLDDAFNEAYQEYLDAWNDAFANVEDKAQGIADKIQAFFKDLFKPIAAAWDSEGNRVMVGWNRALQEVGKLAKDIGRDFMTMWQQQGTVDIFKDIFHIIGDIGFIVGNLASNFRNAWNENNVGLEIFKNIRDIIGIIIEHIKNAADATVEWSANLNFYPVLDAFNRFLESFKPAVDALSGILEDLYIKVLLPLGKWTIEEGLPKLLDVFTAFNDKVDWEALRRNLSEFWEHLEPFAETVGEGLIIFIDRVSDALASFLNSETFANFLHSIGEWMDNVTPEDVADALEKIAKAIIALKIALAGFELAAGFVGFIEILSKFAKFTGMPKLLQGIGKGISSLSSGISAGIAGAGGLANLLTLDVTALVAEGGFATAGLTIGTAIIGGVIAAIGGWNFGQFLYEKFTGEEIDMSWAEQFDEIKNSFSDGSWKGAIDLWAQDIYDGLVQLGEDEEKWAKETGESINKFMEDTFGEWAGTTLPEFGNNLKSWWDTDIKGAFSLWGQEISAFWEENIAPWFTFEKWSELGQGILDGISTKWNELSAWWGDTAIVSWWDENVSPWFTVEKWGELGENIKSGISEKWNEFSEWWQTTGIYNWWNDNVSPWFEKDKWSFSGIKEGLSEAWNAAINSIKQIWNRFASWLNEKLTWTINPISIGGKTVFEGATIDLGKIPMFAKGAVFRGGNPFMAIVNDQPRGQTNIEAPLKVIRQALREELTSLIDNVQLTPTFKVGQFQPAPPPEFDFERRCQNSYQAAESYWREEERQRRESNYDGFDGELPSDIERKLYDIIYSATRAANKNSQSSFDNEKQIRLQVDLDGDKLYDKIYRINSKRNYHGLHSFVPEI